MKRIAIIGAGVSGMAAARALSPTASVRVFESAHSPGGLIKCETVGGDLFHTCGGHVLNSKRADVLDWLWSHFDREREFVKADRNSVVFMPGGPEVPYPVENHLYMFDDSVVKAVIGELVAPHGPAPANFGDFLRDKFGQTLYDLYFGPYNRKIWRRDLADVPLDWLEGKLPMPSVTEIIYNNIRRVDERQFVHSTFWYERRGGSQFLADRLATGLDISYDTPVTHLERRGSAWVVDGAEFDAVVYTGSLRELPRLMGCDFPDGYAGVVGLEGHGTTTVLCHIDANPYSWIYLPSSDFDAHRIICTGNFSAANNAAPAGRISATVEFTGEVDRDEICRQLASVPLHPRHITHRYNALTYPLQTTGTRDMRDSLKRELSARGLWLTGRFADWEYYNMDVAIGAALDTARDLQAAIND